MNRLQMFMMKTDKAVTKPFKNTRMCIACRVKKPKNELLHLCFDGKEILINPKCSAGRGAGICNNIYCIKKAFSKQAFDRAFKIKFDSKELLKLEERLSKMEEF